MKKLSSLLVFALFAFSYLSEAQSNPSDIASFSVPQDLPANIQARITEINKLVAAERLYLTKELAVRSVSDAPDQTQAMQTLTDADFVNFFQNTAISQATTPNLLRLSLSQVLQQKTGTQWPVLIELADADLNKILQVGLDFNDPLVSHFKQLGAMTGQADKTSLNQTPIMWDQNAQTMLKDPTQRKAPPGTEYNLSTQQGLTPFWANHRHVIERIGLQQGSPFGFLSFVREKIFGQIWARFNVLDSKNPAYLVSHSANGTPEVDFVFTRIGGNDKESDLSFAWIATTDGIIPATDVPANGDITPLLQQQVWTADTSEVDGDWYHKLSGFLDGSRYSTQDDLWILGQYDAINNQLKAFQVESVNLQTYQWSLFRFKNADGKIVRVRVFKDLWGDEADALVNHATGNTKRIIIIGNANVPKSAATAQGIQRGDIVVPNGYRNLYRMGGFNGQPPSVGKNDTAISLPSLPGLNYKNIDKISSAKSTFIENADWLNFEASNGVTAIDNESAVLTQLQGMNAVPTTAIYLVSNIVDGVSVDTSPNPPLYEQSRAQIITQVLNLVGASQAQVVGDETLDRDTLISNAIANTLPKSAGSIDRWKLSKNLLASIESQPQNASITGDWINQEALTLYGSQTKINDGDYFDLLSSINAVVSKVSAELIQQRINVMFTMPKNILAAEADPSKVVQVGISSWAPQSPQMQQLWPLVDQIVANYNSNRIQFVVYKTQTSSEITLSQDQLSNSTWGLTETLKKEIAQDIGINFVSRDDGTTYTQFAPKSFTFVFNGWISPTQQSPYLALLTPTDSEKALLAQIGSIPQIRDTLIAAKDRINVNQTVGHHDIQEKHPDWDAAVELRVQRVPAQPQRLLQFEYGKDTSGDKARLYVNLEISDADTSWDFALVEATELLNRFFVNGDPINHYRMTTGEYLEMLLNVDQGSSKSQYFFISEYAAMLKNLASNLTKYFPDDNARLQIAQTYITQRLNRLAPLQSQVFDGYQRELAYRQKIGAARQKQKLKLEDKYNTFLEDRDAFLAQLRPDFPGLNEYVALNPKILALSNNRAGLVKLFTTFLPWEKLEPVEMRYWKQVMAAMQNPVPPDQRKIYFRGLAGSDGGHMVMTASREDLALVPTLGNKMVLMPVGWAIGEDSPPSNLNYLDYFYEILGGGFINDPNVPDWAKAIRLLNTEGRWHSDTPKGSAFLSTSNFNVALEFSDQMNPQSGTALAALLVDPRVVVPNFVSGFTNEYERLTTLLDYPDEIIKMYLPAELKAMESQNGVVDRNLVLKSVAAAAKTAGVSRDISLDEIFFEPTPADSAVEWWHNIIETTPVLSPADFIDTMKTGIEAELLRDIQQAAPFQPIRKN